MFGLRFTDTPAIEPSHPARADIALFVGWTTRRAGSAVPPAVRRWLRERRHLADWAGPTPTLPTDPAAADPLLDMPVPIDQWPTFDALFDWHARPLSAGANDHADDHLGLAVRDFFANGGRKCYVVRLGEPWAVTPTPTASQRAAALAQLLPLAGAASWQSHTWRGIDHAAALADVSLVLVPDLPSLLATPPRRLAGDAAEPLGEPEVFVECAATQTAAPAVAGVRLIAAPVLDDDAMAAWCATAAQLRERLALRRRDLMLLLAVPLPQAGSRAERRLSEALSVRSSLLQLAWPWLVPLRAARTPQGLLPPDGALAGLVAGSVLARGAARTAAGQAPAGVHSLYPAVPDAELRSSLSTLDGSAWVSRFSLFGPTARGIELLSDMSASAVPAWRHAGVVRLMGQLLRSARAVGETLVFEPSGEALWAQLSRRFEALLTRYWQAGALRGASATEAFSVMCGRSTMSQSDIDAGRVVVRIEFVPQLGIERLSVALALSEDGSVAWTAAEPLTEAQP